MMNCKDVTKVISLEEKSVWRKKIGIWLHLIFCKHCRNYEKQIEILNKSVKLVYNNFKNSISKNKIENLENRIINKLKNEDFDND